MRKLTPAIVTAIAVLASSAWAQDPVDPDDPSVSTNKAIRHTVFIQEDGTIFPPLVLFDVNDDIVFVNMRKGNDDEVQIEFTNKYSDGIGTDFLSSAIGAYPSDRDRNNYSEVHALEIGYALVVDSSDITFGNADFNLNTPRCFRAVRTTGADFPGGRLEAQRVAGIAPSGNNIDNVIVPECLRDNSPYIDPTQTTVEQP